MSKLRVVISWIIILGGLSFLPACSSKGNNEQKPMQIESVEQAVQLIKDYKSEPDGFLLPIPLNRQLTLRGEKVLSDVAMAVITDQVLDKGWMPAGFEEKEGVRYYKYSH